MITEYLVNKDPSLTAHDEGEWSKTHSEYTAFNDGGVECEVGEFLYGMVRLLKPQHILETGTHMGISSSYMAQALKDNGRGLLTTLEIEKQHIRTSEWRWKQLDLERYVICDKEMSLEYDLEYECDLMFLDSEPYFRFKELKRFYPKLKNGGYAFIHDTPRTLCQGNVNPDHPEFKSWPFGDINEEVKNWVLDNDLVPFYFPNPRGMVGFYKRHQDDFKWGRL